MLTKYKNLLLLHLIVFIYGFTGILGALITIPSGQLVWYRMMIALIGIAAFVFIKKLLQRVTLQVMAKFLATGLVIALHWIFFFEAIKVSTVSVTLATLSSATLFTALLEPLFFRRKIRVYELLFGLVILLGLYLIFSFEFKYRLGIAYTLFSSLMASLFTVINGKFASKYNPSTVALYEMGGGFLCISIFFLLNQEMDSGLFVVHFHDLAYLLILGIVCTAFAFIVGIYVMKELSPFTVTMAINLEPVYGIILAWVVYKEAEQMTPGFYAGTIIILASIFTNGWLKARERKMEKQKQDKQDY